jgi:fatty acid desaturase
MHRKPMPEPFSPFIPEIRRDRPRRDWRSVMEAFLFTLAWLAAVAGVGSLLIWLFRGWSYL